MNGERPKQIQSLSRALSIIEAVSQSSTPLTLTNLSRELDLTMSTVQRLVNTLIDWGYLNREAETKKYFLGPRLVSLGWSVLRNTDLRTVASPIMEELSEKTGEGASLAVLDGDKIVYILRTKTQHVVGINLHVGDRFPLHCTSTGKAVLAFQSPERVDEIIRKIKFTPSTATTITSEKDLREELVRIKERGFSINNEELTVGARSVGAPVRDHTGKVIAAVSVGVPSYRASVEELERVFAPSVIDTADTISSRMGYIKG